MVGRRMLAVLAATAALTAGVAGHALAAVDPPGVTIPPPALSGEHLEDRGTGDTRVDITCGAVDQPVSGRETTSGVATGPYPGTYTETATFTVRTLERSATANNLILAYEATFTITSGATRVTGTKRYVTGGGYCDTVGPSGGAEIAYVDSSYEAVIETADGAFTDRGTNRSVFQDRQVSPDYPDRVREHVEEFLLGVPVTLPVTLPGTPPVDPTTPAEPPTTVVPTVPVLPAAPHDGGHHSCWARCAGST